MIEIDREEYSNHVNVAKITVIGVGGAGGNTVNCMIQSQYEGVNFICVNTDAQALKLSQAPVKIQIGHKSTKGLGAGANPEVGKRAAEEDIEKVLEAVGEADIVFLTAGMGGGTGSGALPVIVQTLKERGILTIVVITKPFIFEGKRRLLIAEQAIERIRLYADTLLIIPNQKLLDLVDEKVSMIDGFSMINEVLNQSVKGISDIITRAGHINVDFADVREIMRDQGVAVMGTGRAAGQDRARKAALAAISSPILENMSIAGARGVLLNITGGTNLGLHEISQAASVVYEQADEQANIILGSVIDTNMSDEIAVTVIATGFNRQEKNDNSAGQAVCKQSQPLQEAQQKKYEPVQVFAPVEKPQVNIQQVQNKEVYKLQPQESVIHLAHTPQPAREEQPVVEVKQVASEGAPVREAQPAHYFIPPAAREERREERKEEVKQSLALQHEDKPVDIKDLDVPAFMRKQAREKLQGE